MTNSIWHAFSDTTHFRPLDEDINVDVAIIGGGITGVTCGQLLAQGGLKVAILEKDKVGLGSTGHSTGNLYGAVNEMLLSVRNKFGDDVLEMVVESRKSAIGLIEDNINKFGIDCDFKRVNWNYYSMLKQNERKIIKAYKAAIKIKLKAEYSDLPELPFKVKKGMKLEGAAQFNPLRYVQGLARAIAGDRCRIFENTEITEIHEGKEDVLLRSKDGRNIRASYMVHATHTPKGIMTLHAELGPYREYGIACKIKGKHPEGVYFGYFVPSETISTRLYERDADQYLLVVGEPHKVGHDDNLSHLNRLEKFAKDHFEVLEVTHRWAAQNYRAPDYLPFIGAKGEGSRIYIGTGFSTHGLTYGTLAAQIISDQISGRDNPYVEIYRPTRFTPIKSAPKLIKENVDVLMNYLKDYFLKKSKEKLLDVKKGEGKIIEEQGHKLAVYRSENEGLQICSAICTHMGCVVHWNNAEHSWDCPCHGSRFKTSGEVLEGPALRALADLAELTGVSDRVAYGNNVSGETPDLRGHDHRTDQEHVMSMDELVDEASIESFPASDPPGYSSRSKIDKDQHREF